MKKTPTVNVKKATQEYCHTCGVICEGFYSCKTAMVECARKTHSNEVYYCSMTCGKAHIFKDAEKNCKMLEETLTYNYTMIKDEITIVLIADPKKCSPGAFVLCKSLKIQVEILKSLRKHDWLSAGLLYRDNKNLFTEAGELILSDEKKYIDYLNKLKAIQVLGLSLTNILNRDKAGRQTNNAKDLWK